MFSATTKAPTKSTDHQAPRNTSDKAQKLLDARIKHIKKNILPESPYIISAENSLPSAHIRRIHPNNSSGWRKHTNFAENEKQLQYLSFKDRSRDMSMKGMHARGGWDDGKGSLDRGGEKTSFTSSDAATPHPNQGPKRKITLADYKNKDRSKVAPAAGLKAPASEPGQDTKAVEKRTEHAPTFPDPTIPQTSEQHGTKRSADTMTAANELQALEAPLDVPPAKKPRTTPEPDTNAADNLPKPTPPMVIHKVVQNDAKAESLKVPSSTMHHEEKSPKSGAPTLKVKLKLPKTQMTTAHGLPRMLSPTEKTVAHNLPRMLSPLSLSSDIEADIEEELARRTPTPSLRGDASSAEKAKTSRDDFNATPSSNEKPSASKVKQKAAPKIAFTSTKGPQESKGVTSAPRQGIKDVGFEKAVAAKPTSDGVTKPPTPTVKAVIPEAPKKLRRRITIRIKKKGNRKLLREYLRLKPTPGKYPPGMHREDSTEAPRSEVRQNDKKDDEKRTEWQAPKAGEKRRRLQDDEDENEPEPVIKRQRIPGGLPQKTHTPKQSSISSPALSHLGSARKARLSTPDIGLTSTPMMRAGSGGSSVHTPRQLAMNGTPIAPDTGNSRTSTNLPSASKPKTADLSVDAKRLLKLGADLKHDADRFFKAPGGMSEVDRKHGVILGIESVLCFMLSFTLNEVCMQSGDRTSWKSMFPFLAKVNEEAKPFRHLAGLALQIESIIRDILVQIDTRRLNRNPLDDYFVNPKTADSAKTVEQNKAAEYALQFAELCGNVDRAQNLLRSSWAYLNPEEISTKFPDTWAKREDVRPPIGKGSEAIKVGEYKRTITLPVNSTTSKLEAVNFGVSILAEYCRNEGVDFAPKLVI